MRVCDTLMINCNTSLPTAQGTPYLFTDPKNINMCKIFFRRQKLESIEITVKYIFSTLDLNNRYV